MNVRKTKPNSYEEKNVRLQFDLPKYRVREIDELMRLTDTPTRKDYVNNALTLLEWAIKQRLSGRIVASIDEAKQQYRELEMPILSNAAEHDTKKVAVGR